MMFKFFYIYSLQSKGLSSRLRNALGSIGLGRRAASSYKFVPPDDQDDFSTKVRYTEPRGVGGITESSLNRGFEKRCYVKHQSIFVVTKTTPKENYKFKSGAAPLFHSSDLPIQCSRSVYKGHPSN